MAAGGKEGGSTNFDLGDMIKERKLAEQLKAKERLLIDSNRIKSLNWNSPDGVHPLQIFPKEVWEPILNCLGDPRDLQNASLCCPLFATILEPRLVSDSLFPLALEVTKFRKYLKTARQYPLQLRLVCRSLRDQVDKCEESCVDCYIASDVEFERTEKPPCLRIFYERGRSQNLGFEKLEKISDYFDPSCETRAVRLPIRAWEVGFFEYQNNYEREKLRDLCSVLSDALHLVGGQIMIFRFHLTYASTAIPAEAYNTLRSWLEAMPNLKSLELKLSQGVFSHTCVIPRHALSKAIQANPFPTLRSLLKFEFGVEHGLNEAAILKGVLSSNRHVKNVSLAGDIRDFGDLKLLKSLDLHSFRLYLESKTPNRDLEKFSHPRPNWHLHLKEIKLKFFKCHLSMQQVFKFLNTFQNLESVYLELDDVDMPENEEMTFLKLTKVQKFSFCYHRFMGNQSYALETINPNYTLSLDNLITAEALEEIRWGIQILPAPVTKVIPPPRQDLLEFNGGTHDLSQSNLWKVFPTLKILRVRNSSTHSDFVFHRRQKIEKGTWSA